jgi:eukaryotic-like serine/threonine-protein kinase
MLAPETILQSRYRIVRQLGQGGMGAVYEAVDTRLDTTVALKETLLTDEKLRKQFEREARLLARLHHQALPRVSDHFNEGEGQFLVMQYIAGDDLAEMLAHQNRPFSPDVVLRWGDQLCDALDYLHTQDPQIIHRDIKPQNLKLTGRGQIVLLDFGLAKGSVGPLTAVTTSASIFGYTPNYAPLEQVQGLGTDARSDLYSLAATLYHLITNVKPPDALSRAGALVNGQPDPLLLANLAVPQVSWAVANVLGKGMSQKRDDRFASAEIMREALRVASVSTAQLGDSATVLASSAATSSGAHTVASDRSTKLMTEQTQAAGSEAQTLLANDTTKVRSALAGNEAATIARTKPSRSGPRKWFAAAFVSLLVAGSAGGFFLYRARHNQPKAAPAFSQTPAQTNQPVVTTSPRMSESPEITTKVSETKEEKSKRQSASQRSAKQSAQNTNEAMSTRSQTGSDQPAHQRDQIPDRGRGAFGPPPGSLPRRGGPPFDPRNPPGSQPGHPTGQGTEIRTFPNGSKVVKQPDGTWIWIGPKGQTRVIPPGEKPNRNPNRNRP